MEGVPIQETMLSEMCPDIESAFCFPHKYRTINGECNNVKNPTWGITGAAYLRILEPTYQDGETASEVIGSAQNRNCPVSDCILHYALHCVAAVGWMLATQSSLCCSCICEEMT